MKSIHQQALQLTNDLKFAQWELRSANIHAVEEDDTVRQTNMGAMGRTLLQRTGILKEEMRKASVQWSERDHAGYRGKRQSFAEMNQVN